MTKEIINCKIKQNREKYEEKLDAICDMVKDIVPLKIRISFKRKKCDFLTLSSTDKAENLIKES